MGLLVDPPGNLEAAILARVLAVFPGLLSHFDPTYATLYTNPLFMVWVGLRVAAGLAVCIPLAAACRWYFRLRSDPDSLLGAFLTSLPIGLGWWLVMLLFLVTGQNDPSLREEGLGIFALLIALTPALLLSATASLVQQFGSGRPGSPWNGGDQSIWSAGISDQVRPSLSLYRVDLEPAIKAIELDRTALTLLGAFVSSIAAMSGLVLFVVALVVLVDLVRTGQWPTEGLLGDGAEMLGIGIAVPLVGFGLLAVLRWLRPVWFGVTMLLLVFVGLGFVLAEPVQLASIVADGPDAQKLKDQLLVRAAWTLPVTFLILALWLLAGLRFGRFLPGLGRKGLTPLGLVLADIVGMPRLILSLGIRNWLAQLMGALGLVMQSLLRLYVIAAISTGVLATFNSPLAWAKYHISNGSSACLGVAKFDPFVPLTRIAVCPGNPDFDTAMFQLGQLPSFLQPLMLFIIVIPALAGLWLGRAALAASARRYQRVASADPRPPILYLRPFHLDRVSLKWRPRLLSTVIVPRPAEPRSIDEIILNGCIEDGPVVAYGRPGEPAPPLGAARLYVGTGDWKAMVYALADASRYIVIAVEPTDGVVWEVEQTIANGWADKTLYLLTSARNAEEAWRMVRAITGHGPDEAPAPGRLRPVAIIQRSGVWQVLFARDISRLAVEAAVQHFRMAA